MNTLIFLCLLLFLVIHQLSHSLIKAWNAPQNDIYSFAHFEIVRISNYANGSTVGHKDVSYFTEKSFELNFGPADYHLPAGARIHFFDMTITS